VYAIQHLAENGWNRSQVSCHLGIWKCLGNNISKYIERLREDVIQLLGENCYTTEKVLEKTWACHDVVALLKHMSFPQRS
jgi:hypothetical protein